MNRLVRIGCVAGLLALGGCSDARLLDASADCAGFDAAQCLASAACTYELTGRGEYRCRIAADHCESAFRQDESTAEQCEQRAGCVYDPGRCFCAPGLTCVCGGGPPPTCRAAADDG